MIDECKQTRKPHHFMVRLGIVRTVSKSMRLVFFILPGLIVRFDRRFPIGTQTGSLRTAFN